MSSEPKAVGYVNGDGLNELKAGKAAGITVGIYSETLPRTTPLYDEQALSALRAEVEALQVVLAHVQQDINWMTNEGKLLNRDVFSYLDAAMEQSA